MTTPIKLREQPKAVRRFKRAVVIGIAATGCVVIAGATLVALYPPSFKRDGKELYNTDRKPPPEGLNALPRDYGGLKPPPALGPPLPGDLGPAVVQRERDMGIRPAPPASPFRPDPEADAARAERMRLAKQEQQAKEAGVFFKLAARHDGTAMMAGKISDSANLAQAGAAPLAAAERRLEHDPERDPNFQQRKLDFVGKRAERNVYNPHRLEEPVSAYQVMAGTVIAASLVTGLNSDLPGFVIAQVTEPVYDSVTGRHVLIPQGTRIVGQYDSVVAFGQKRALFVWNRLIMPDGSSIVIDNLPATNAAGYAGLEDEVDLHTWQLLKGVALSTLLGVGAELGLGGEGGDLARTLRQSAQGPVNRAGQRIVERNLNIQPTITVRPGWPLRVVVHKDIVLRAYRT